jgi:hypothetical protein
MPKRDGSDVIWRRMPLALIFRAIYDSSLGFDVTVQARQIIDTEIGHKHAEKPHEGHDGHTPAPPPAYIAGMKHGRVNKPGN